jgi:hypothetical protein
MIIVCAGKGWTAEGDTGVVAGTWGELRCDEDKEAGNFPL